MSLVARFKNERFLLKGEIVETSATVRDHLITHISGNGRYGFFDTVGQSIIDFNKVYPTEYYGFYCGQESYNLLKQNGLDTDFSLYEVGEKSNPNGWSNNFTSRFSNENNWNSNIEYITDLEGYTKAFHIKTSTDGSGGWTSSFSSSSYGTILFSALVKVNYGGVAFGNLNTSNNIYKESTNGEWVWIHSLNPNWDNVTSGTGTHLYAIGISDFYVAAVSAINIDTFNGFHEMYKPNSYLSISTEKTFNFLEDNFSISFDMIVDSSNPVSMSNSVKITGLGTFWKYKPSDSTDSRKFIWDFDNKGTRSFMDLNSSEIFNHNKKEKITITWDTDKLTVYRNKQLWGSAIPKIAADITSGNSILFSDKLGAFISNVSIFDKCISFEEVKKLHDTKLSFTENNIYTNNFNEVNYSKFDWDLVNKYVLDGMEFNNSYGYDNIFGLMYTFNYADEQAMIDAGHSEAVELLKNRSSSTDGSIILGSVLAYERDNTYGSLLNYDNVGSFMEIKSLTQHYIVRKIYELGSGDDSGLWQVVYVYYTDGKRHNPNLSNRDIKYIPSEEFNKKMLSIDEKSFSTSSILYEGWGEW